MAIREDVVVSATRFLQDPNVASSPIQNRIAFLQAKNLTQEEIDVALARAADGGGAVPPNPTGLAGPAPPPFAPGAYRSGDAAYGWRHPPPELPRRDWRDWFIMATVMGGVGYGLYSMTMRYIYPLIAPPAPGRLEQDKKLVDEQFERVFELVEQLADNMKKLEAAEAERAKNIDTALEDLEGVIDQLKTAQESRDEDAKRIRDDIRALHKGLPRLLDAQKETHEARMREVTGELKSLRTLVVQRVNPNATAQQANPNGAAATAGNYLRHSGGNAPVPGTRAGIPGAAGEENAPPDMIAAEQSKPAPTFGSGVAVAIPAWQRAMLTQAPQATAKQALAIPGAASPTTLGQPLAASPTSPLEPGAGIPTAAPPADTNGPSAATAEQEAGSSAS